VPELPEVEITRQRVAPILVGRGIASVETTSQSYFFLSSPRRLRTRLVGRRVVELSRRGKYLLARLDDESTLFLHLGMTGQLFSSTAWSPRLLTRSARGALAPEAQRGFVADEHTHLTLNFEDGPPSLHFRDVRKFGKVELLAPGKTSPRLTRLGPDALEASGEVLFERSRRRTVAVKTLLLNQSVLAGVGNIYADEALFLAGIRPRRPAHRLTPKQCNAIARALRRVLKRSIETGGSSISDFVGPDGADGRYQDERHVYARTGEPCKRCRTAIRRVVLTARSAHFCPACQK
jgi:formamidopyrimidine-DNA glycosylase